MVLLGIMLNIYLFLCVWPECKKGITLQTQIQVSYSQCQLLSDVNISCKEMPGHVVQMVARLT